MAKETCSTERGGEGGGEGAARAEGRPAEGEWRVGFGGRRRLSSLVDDLGFQESREGGGRRDVSMHGVLIILSFRPMLPFARKD